MWHPYPDPAAHTLGSIMTDTTRMEIAYRQPARPPKEIKIRLPQEMCVRLHSRKILSGVTIAETVAAALDAYFRQPAALALPADAAATTDA